VIGRHLIAAVLTTSLAIAAWPAPAWAVIPSAHKIAKAVAEANRSAGRAHPVLLDVTLTIGDGPPAAKGVLATHPTGPLASFGIAADEAVLGRVGDADCYVFGGRLPRDLETQDERLPSMWVDLDSFDVVRIDGSDGVRYRFGPSQEFDGIRVPRWIAIEFDGEPATRIDILRAARANAPAAAFGRDWLTTPDAP